MFAQAVRRLRAGVLVLGATTGLGSCAVGPDFLHPAAPDVARYTREPLAPVTSSTDGRTGQAQHFVQGRDLQQEWWRLFRSPALNALIQRSLSNNPNLQSSIATLRAANQTVYAQEGKFFPLVEGDFNPSYNRTSNALTPVPSSNAMIYQLHTAQLQVTYSLDVWGLNRRTVESLQAQADNQRFQVEAAYLTLVSNIALAAINEASLRAQIDATNELISINTKMLGILEKQLKAGSVSDGDVELQRAALAQVLATLPPLRKALQQSRDLLSALAGVYTSEEPNERFHLDDLHLPTDLPVSVPSQLIEQRPDIRASQEALHSASAQIGVAIANMLPNFTINGNVGYMNTALAGLLAPQNLFWTVAGSAAQTVLDGGTLFHQMQAAKDNYNAAAWGYRGTVVGAVQNVTDSLRALQNDADALKAARDFETASKKSFGLARQQLDAGYANILILLTAEQTYLQAVIQVVQARAARLSDTVALYQALGGGWWNRTEPLPEKILNVGTGQAANVAEKDKGEGFLRGIFYSPFQPD
jgi:NodT family efflux transporter outer membrane factor (OMF) lipoprotein